MNWSSYQRNIFEAVASSSDSLLIEACAGSGKTTTIVEAITHVSQEQSIVLLAFNKAIQTALASKVTAPNARCMTLHSCGLSAWKRFIGPEAASSLRVDGGKTRELIRELVSYQESRRFPALQKIIGLAKQVGIVSGGKVRLEGAFAGSMSDSSPSGGVEGSSNDERVNLPPQRLSVGGSVDLADLPDEPAAQFSSIYCSGLIEDSIENWRGLMEEYGIDEDEVDINIARRVLRESILRSTSHIDFDDMLMMPVVGGASFYKYDVVFVDEAQDVSGIQMEMISRMNRGRVIAVGDSNQAIYAFRGAGINSMPEIEARFNCKRLPLSISYRCPQSVVRKAQTWVPSIQWAEGAEEGVVVEYPDHSPSCLMPQSLQGNAEVLSHCYANHDASSLVECPCGGSPGTPSCDYDGQQKKCTCTGKFILFDFLPTDAILCRLTRPLVETAFKLIRARISCKVLGRDIGSGLVALVKKSKLDESRSIADYEQWLDKYAAGERKKLTAKEEWSKLGLFEDKITTLMCFVDDLDSSDSINMLIRSIENLFKDDGAAQSITLATIHKSKGLEFERVFILDAHELMPVPWGKRPSDKQQEINLMYVAATRARHSLFYIESKRLG